MASDSADGLVSVRDGISLTIDDEHEGSVRVEGGGTLVVAGVLRGSLTIESLASATVTGDVVGDIEVLVAANLVIAPEGRVFGTVTNHGSFINRGLRAGRVVGRAPDESDGGSQLDSTWDGSGAYRLPARTSPSTPAP